MRLPNAESAQSWMVLLELLEVPGIGGEHEVTERSSHGRNKGVDCARASASVRERATGRFVGDVGMMELIGPSYQVLGTANLWIGVVLGAAMIFGAIRMRRWRDEG